MVHDIRHTVLDGERTIDDPRIGCKCLSFDNSVNAHKMAAGHRTVCSNQCVKVLQFLGNEVV